MADNTSLIQGSEGVQGLQGTSDNLSLDEAIKLLNAERLAYLRDKTTDKIADLQKLQKSIENLQTLLQRINSLTDKDGKVDFSKDTGTPKIEDLIKEAKEFGVKWDKTTTKLTRDEKDQLVGNVRMTIDNYNVKNDMALQEMTRLTNERYESYQIAQAIMKPLNEAKKNIARAARGA